MWSEAELNQFRDRLLAPEAEQLIRFMGQKSMMADAAAFAPVAAPVAEGLGWIDGPEGQLTPQGGMAADSCREYAFWLDRDKALPFEGAAPHLTASYFSNRKVMEIGAGMGANLLSLSAAGAEVCGIEPVAGYRQMGAIFAEREGLKAADIRDGQAEKLPFADDEVDLVLCVTSHQYFEIHQALAEISRILTPGGELIIVGGTLGAYGWYEAPALFRGLGQAKAYTVTMVNTLAYTVSGRRLLRPPGAYSTSRPIYPSRSAMRRWLAAAGLTQISPECSAGVETCFHYSAAS